MADKKTLLTREGLAELTSRLKSLKEEKRVDIAARLKEAISFGDLRENSEYEAVRTEQSQVEQEIIELEELLKNAEIIDEKTSKRKGVMIGSVVTIQSLSDDDEASESFKIVGAREADILDEKLMRLSNESPIGTALIGHDVGETVSGKIGERTFSFKILDIK